MPKLGSQGSQGLELMERGQDGSVLGQGAGSRKPEEPLAQVSPCWCPWQVGQDRCAPVGVPWLVCPHRCAPTHGPQQVCQFSWEE